MMSAFRPVEATASSLCRSPADPWNFNSERLEPSSSGGRHSVRLGACSPKKLTLDKSIRYLHSEPTGKVTIASARVGQAAGYGFRVRSGFLLELRCRRQRKKSLDCIGNIGAAQPIISMPPLALDRSEERRVGKECRS